MLIKEKEKEYMLYVCVCVCLFVCRITNNTFSLAGSWESSQGCYHHQHRHRHRHRHLYHHHHLGGPSFIIHAKTSKGVNSTIGKLGMCFLRLKHVL